MPMDKYGKFKNLFFPLSSNHVYYKKLYQYEPDFSEIFWYFTNVCSLVYCSTTELS